MTIKGKKPREIFPNLSLIKTKSTSFEKWIKYLGKIAFAYPHLDPIVLSIIILLFKKSSVVLWINSHE